MRPVIKVAPAMNATMIITTRKRTVLNSGSDGSKGIKNLYNAKGSRMEAITNPVDHLPKGVLGKIVTPMLLS
jgi:hypothetical protein